jgi:predicted DCC family thiol-disulfide oxidoreductase YuxK
MKSTPILFFDEECFLCSKSVTWIIEREKKDEILFARLPTNSNIRPDSLIFLNECRIYLASDALLQICRYLKFPYNICLIGYFIPRFFRDYLYNLIAKNRHRIFRNRNHCLIVNDQLKQRFIE